MSSTNPKLEQFKAREKIDHDIVEGQVYRDNRDSERMGQDVYFTTLYIDEYRVFSKSSLDHPRWDGPTYRAERRGEFEEAVACEMYRLEEGSKGPNGKDNLTELRAMVKRERDRYRGGGRKEKHYAEAYDRLIDLISDLDSDPVDFESVPGIGKRTTEKLKAAGFRTEADVRRATREELIAIDGMGEKNTDALLEEVE